MFINDYEQCNYAFDFPRQGAYELLQNVSKHMQQSDIYDYYIVIEKFPNLEPDIYEENHDEIIIGVCKK